MERREEGYFVGGKVNAHSRRMRLCRRAWQADLQGKAWHCRPLGSDDRTYLGTGSAHLPSSTGRHLG